MKPQDPMIPPATLLRQAIVSPAPTTASTLVALTQHHGASTAVVAVQVEAVLVEAVLVLVAQALLPVVEVLLLAADKTNLVELFIVI